MVVELNLMLNYMIEIILHFKLEQVIDVTRLVVKDLQSLLKLVLGI